MANRRVQLFYDFVDPLSYLVVRELRTLSSITDETLSWHPFELRPPPTPLVTLDDAGVSERWHEARHLTEGSVAFDPPRLVPWTRKAHELVLHASEHDLEVRVRNRIFEAYLLEGADIGRVDILVELATDLGLDRLDTKAVLDVDRHEAEAAALRAAALAAGVTDTPTVLCGDRRLEGFHNRDRLGTLLGT